MSSIDAFKENIFYSSKNHIVNIFRIFTQRPTNIFAGSDFSKASILCEALLKMRSFKNPVPEGLVVMKLRNNWIKMWIKDSLMTFYLDDREMGPYNFSSKKIVVDKQEVGSVDQPEFFSTFNIPILSTLLKQKLHADIIYGGKIVAMTAIVEDGLNKLFEPLGDIRVWKSTEIIREIPTNMKVFVISLAGYLAFLREHERKNNSRRTRRR